MSNQNSSGGIQRARSSNRNNFTIISNEVFSGHPELSWRALGILGYLLSLPDDWRTSADKIASLHKEGRDAVRKAMTELEDVGYLVRNRSRNDRGQWMNSHIVYETPQPKPEKPVEEDVPEVPLDQLVEPDESLR